MLETLLNIGKTLREAGLMKHHRYIKPAPLSDKKTSVTYISIPVDKEFNFDLNSRTFIQDEDLIRHNLYYLSFKTSDSDGLVKYIFGDICYGTDKNGKEIGYYRMEDSEAKGTYRLSSFNRGREDAKAFVGTGIERFRATFEANLEEIESLLKEHGRERLIFLNFNFEGRHWYEFKAEFDAINQKLLSEFLSEHEGQYVLRKSLYKTLASPDKDLQFPGFNENNIYKTKRFKDQEEVLDLLYAIDYSGRARMRERDIKIIVLPKGNNLMASHIEDFFERKGFNDESQDEERLNESNKRISKDDLFDSLFEPVVNNVAENITHYDLIFSKAGGVTAPDVDMIEISSIEKSFLADLNQRIEKIRHPLREERDNIYPKRPKEFIYLDIKNAFLNIFGDTTTDKKKYQNHLFKVLPQIYTGTYYEDALLLPTFIEKTEFNMRNDRSNFNLLKYDFYLLTLLRNPDGEKFMQEMKSSKSYQVGILLGKMAQPLDRKIASFEKNYVGLLSRRIADRQGLIKFANFINEKLAIHNVAYPNLKESFVEMAEILNHMNDSEYHKNLCAFGFFESYFSRFEDFNKTDEEIGLSPSTTA
jgi:hypothetical protein